MRVKRAGRFAPFVSTSFFILQYQAEFTSSTSSGQTYCYLPWSSACLHFRTHPAHLGDLLTTLNCHRLGCTGWMISTGRQLTCQTWRTWEDHDLAIYRIFPLDSRSFYSQIKILSVNNMINTNSHSTKCSSACCCPASRKYFTYGVNSKFLLTSLKSCCKVCAKFSLF